MHARCVIATLLFVSVRGKVLSTDCTNTTTLAGKYHAASSKCIAMFTTAMTWPAAYDDCASRGAQSSYLGRLLTIIDSSQWSFVTTNFKTQIENYYAWIGVTKKTASTSINSLYWTLTPKTELSASKIATISGIDETLSTSTDMCIRAADESTWKDNGCTSRSYGYLCEYTDQLCPDDTTWSAWSSCSRTCDQGVQYRSKTSYSGNSCIASKTFEYQKCNSGAICYVKSSSTAPPLKSQCASMNGYYAYSSCYFLSNTTSGSGTTTCTNQGAYLASFFGADLVSQLGSVLLSNTSVQGLTSLQLISGSLQWSLNSTNYPFLSNETIATPTQSCVSLISNKNSVGTAPEQPHLGYTTCSGSSIQSVCMKTDHIYSSYDGYIGKLITESSSQSTTYEIDSHSCGVRCSRIISCLGFNYRSSDMSCIPTKVSIRTPSLVAGTTIYTLQNDPAWVFYDRI